MDFFRGIESKNETVLSREVGRHGVGEDKEEDRDTDKDKRRLS
jgi:hypothetical protein